MLEKLVEWQKEEEKRIQINAQKSLEDKEKERRQFEWKL